MCMLIKTQKCTYSCWVRPWLMQYFDQLYLTSLPSANAPSLPPSTAFKSRSSSTSPTCDDRRFAFGTSQSSVCHYLCSFSSFSWYISVIIWSFCCNLWTLTWQLRYSISEAKSKPVQLNKVSPTRDLGHSPDLSSYLSLTAGKTSPSPSLWC